MAILDRVVLSAPTSTEQTVVAHQATTNGVRSNRVSRKTSAKKDAAQTNLERAAYAYVRALRALGRTEVTTAEIASALRVSVAEVDATLAALTKKGVKFA